MMTFVGRLIVIHLFVLLSVSFSATGLAAEETERTRLFALPMEIETDSGADNGDAVI